MSVCHHCRPGVAGDVDGPPLVEGSPDACLLRYYKEAEVMGSEFGFVEPVGTEAPTSKQECVGFVAEESVVEGHGKGPGF